MSTLAREALRTGPPVGGTIYRLELHFPGAPPCGLPGWGWPQASSVRSWKAEVKQVTSEAGSQKAVSLPLAHRPLVPGRAPPRAALP